MTSRASAGALLLFLLCACARPRTAPWSEQVQGAARPLAVALTPAERKDFETGFANGAAMVHQALQWGYRPYRPMLDLPAAAPRLLGPVPADLAPLPERPAPNVDPATGLLMYPAQTFGSDAFSRGQVQGFDWALASIGQSLVKPVARPEAPAEWLAWKDLQTGALDCGDKACRVKWAPGMLAWSLETRGFPARRSWRPWDEPEAPTWAGLARESLWIETQDRQVFVIDLVTGGILDVRAAVAHPVPAWEAPENQGPPDRDPASPETRAEVARLRKAAETGEPKALMALGNVLAVLGPEGEREALTCHLKAAEGGDADAMLLAAVWLYHGRAVAEDRAAARQWVERAVRAGHPEAANVLHQLFP
jgi:hypothetical protein